MGSTTEFQMIQQINNNSINICTHIYVNTNIHRPGYAKMLSVDSRQSVHGYSIS